MQIVALLLTCLPFFTPDSLNGIGGGWRETNLIYNGSLSFPTPDRWMIAESAYSLHGLDTFQVSLTDSGRTLTLQVARQLQIGDTLRLIWQSARISPTTEYYYYSPATPENDSLAPLSPNTTATSKNSSPLDRWGDLKRSGSITRGIQFGEAGNSATSGLHLELSGRVAQNVEVEALVDDQALAASSEGSSTTLKELDRVRVQVNTPSVSGILGDWDLAWRSGRYGTIERQLKGGEVTARRGSVSANAAIAGGGGRFATTQLTGRGGDQGPYELVDRYGSVGVQVASGSEKVQLDGRLLRRGTEADYRIEYDRGRITFNPTVLIQSGSRIEVEYEIVEDAYATNFYGVRSSATQDSWVVEGMVASEGLDSERPLAFEWNDEIRQAAEEAGDDPLGAAASGIDSVGPDNGAYRWGETSNRTLVLEFSPPDSLGHPTGYLRVDFSIDQYGGYERIYDSSLQLFYYQWVGIARGGYSPVRRLPLPDRTRVGQAHIAYTGAEFSSDFEVAGSEYDANLISSIGDDNNRAAAVRWRGAWSGRDSSIAVSLALKQQANGFKTLSNVRDPDYRYYWGYTGDATDASERSIQSDAVFRPLDGLRLAAGFGSIELGDFFTGIRTAFTTDANLNNFTTGAKAEILMTQNDALQANGYTNRLSFHAERERGFIVPSLGLRYERNQFEQLGYLAAGDRFAEAEPGLVINPAAWTKIKLGFVQRNSDVVQNRVYVSNSVSQSARAAWEGRTDNLLWKTSGARTLETTKLNGSSTIHSTQAAASLDAGSKSKPFRFRGSYDLSTGSGRTDAWVATYVGTGRGAYRREGDRYVPDSNGDFDLTIVSTDTIRFATRVQFSGRLDWRSTARADTLPPPFGISGTSTYFDAAVTTYQPDPIRVFLLDRSAFRSADVASMKWNWRQDVNFLEGNSGGDGRLTLRREEARDAGLAGGEETLTESASLRMRFTLTSQATLTVEPATERSARRTIRTDFLRASVRSSGGTVELGLPGPFTGWESTLKSGYERRREAVTGGVVVENSLGESNRIPLGVGGSVRLEGEWRQLTGSGRITGYDLTRGWGIGDNWTASASLDYRIGKNLTATALLRSRWQEHRSPLVSGLAQMTATL